MPLHLLGTVIAHLASPLPTYCIFSNQNQFEAIIRQLFLIILARAAPKWVGLFFNWE